jgi:uncharacterized membrane protein YfcA
MSLPTLALIGATIVFSSFLSGVFGMAGGMVLLGVLLIFFDVAAAMILFSIIQFFANGWRAVQWWSYVRWRIFWFYCLGGTVAFAGMRLIEFVPDKALVYLLLGAMPFVVELVPAEARPNIEWRGVPFITGVLTTVVQFLAGVGGLFLDLFFQKSKLDRKTTLATKAVTQTASHVLRAAYFVSFGSIGDAIGVWPLLAAIALAIGGTALAPYVIERMSDHGFRQWTRAIILTISAIYLIRAGSLYWHAWVGAPG